jgi:hypothetical protein
MRACEVRGRAGLTLSEEKNISPEALFDNLKVVWITKGRQPVYRDMGASPSQYTGSTYGAQFEVISRSNGGETIEENLQTLCFECNRGQGVSDAR